MLDNNLSKQEYKSIEEKINDAIKYCNEKYVLNIGEKVIPNDHRVISISQYLDDLLNKYK